jgi:predicted acetyltransferase
MGIEIRSITEDEVADFRRVMNVTFGGDLRDEEEEKERRRQFLEQVELGRTYAPFDGTEMVGTAAALTFDISLPGGAQTALGGLTMVTVRPSHRRRGLLRRIIQAHFDDCRERGEALSGLWASESSIYGRFGYGNAAPVVDVTIDGPRVGVPAAPDEVRFVDLAQARRILPPLYDRCYLDRPGQLSRTSGWWEYRLFDDPKEWRRGASARRHVVAYRSGAPVGYTWFRQKSKWEDSVAVGTVMAGEVIGVDAAARLSLWSFLCSVDLFPTVVASDFPPDFDLPWQVENPRLIKRHVVDGHYVRVLDVPQALESRGYQTTDSLVLAVHDPMGIAGGTYRLEASSAGAQCRPSDDSPDVSMDVRTLSSLYLGAEGAGPLGRVGRILGEPAAVRRLGALLRSDIAPCCREVY